MLRSMRRSFPLLLIAFGSLAAIQKGLAADGFSLDIGSAVATGSFRAKAAVFAVRSKGCADLASFKLSGAAEGLVNGQRQTVPLANIPAMPTPGVFAIPYQWPREGVWVVSLTGRCGEAAAGALVPIGRNTFERESSQFFPRAATSEEIEASLQALSKPLSQEPGTKR